MALTPEGTPYVESSDLVANYPAASLSLANRVDLVGVLPFATSAARTTAIPSPTDGQYTYLQDTNATEFWNGSAWQVAGTASGLVHVNTTTFTTLSAVNLNNIFTSTYADYLIMSSITMSSSTGALSVRMRVSAADNTTSNYTNGTLTIGSSGTVTGAGASSQTSWDFTGSSSITSARVWSIMRPQLAETTILTQQGVARGTGYNSLVGGFSFDAATVFDGLSVFPGTGTITGVIRVYGYKNS